MSENESQFPGKKPLTWPRTALYALGACIASGIVLLVVMEGAVRVFWPQRAQENWISPNARYGHLYKANDHYRYPFPNTDYVMDVKTNSQGFRDDEPPPPEPGKKTILFMGDSYTMGFGMDLDKRFDRVLEGLLDKDGKHYRFINNGVDGWGTVQETRYVMDHYDLLQPDIIVITFCENDPFDDKSFLEHPGPTPVETGRVRVFLRAHFQLYRLFYVLRWLWQHHGEVDQLGVGEKQPASEDPSLAIAIPEDMWKQSLDRIREFHDEFIKRNPKGVLLVQATAPVSPNVTEHLKQLDNGKDFFYVDLGPAVEALPVKERRLGFDPHWSARVHEISARALHDRIAALPAQ